MKFNYKNKPIGIYFFQKGIFTLMSPLLILLRVPTSNTGVFPYKFLSWRGPNWGRFKPNRAVSPKMIRATRSKNRSTSRIGNHLRRHMDNPKVDRPSISRGRTCTLRSIQEQKLRYSKGEQKD